MIMYNDGDKIRYIGMDGLVYDTLAEAIEATSDR